MSLKFDGKNSPPSLDINLEIDWSVAAADDVDEPQKNLCHIWTVQGIELKLTEAVEDIYGQVSIKLGSKRSPRSLDNYIEINWSVAAEDDIDEPYKNLCHTWTLGGIELKLTEAAEDAYWQVSTKFGSNRSSRSLDINLEIDGRLWRPMTSTSLRRISVKFERLKGES